MDKPQQQPPVYYSMKKRPRKRERKEEKSNSTERSQTSSASAAEARSEASDSKPSSQSALSPHTLGVCPSVSSRYVKVGNRVGEGTYGVVYQALDKVTKRHVALKRCIPHHESSDGFPLTTLREIHTLKVCCMHPNIVDLLDIAVSDKSNSTSSDGSPRGGVFLVFEYCPSDLANILDTYAAEQRHRKRVYHHGRQTQSPFMEDHVKTLTKQLLSAVEWCHRHFLIHRDIKPSNLLYTSNGVLKLCDFGLSRHCSGRVDRQLLTPNVVSLWYRAPELLFKRARGSTASSYSFPIDLFAIGCVFCELLQGFPLLDGRTEMEQIDKMMQCLGQPPTRLYEYRPPTLRSSNFSALWDRFEYLSTEGLTLMTRLLEYDSLQRWTANQALESAYFRLRPLPATKMPSLRELGIETQY